MFCKSICRKYRYLSSPPIVVGEKEVPSDSSELDLKKVICADRVAIVNGGDYVELFDSDYQSHDNIKIDGLSSSYHPSISENSESEEKSV